MKKSKKQMRPFSFTVSGTYHTTKTQQDINALVSAALAGALPDTKDFCSAVVMTNAKLRATTTFRGMHPKVGINRVLVGW